MPAPVHKVPPWQRAMDPRFRPIVRASHHVTPSMSRQRIFAKKDAADYGEGAYAMQDTVEGQTADELLAAIDTDGDGVITQAELHAAMGTRHAAVDGDGNERPPSRGFRDIGKNFAVKWGIRREWGPVWDAHWQRWTTQ